MKVFAINIQELKKERQEVLLQYIDMERKKRIKNIKNNEDRLRSIGAGLLLQYAFLKQGYEKEVWRNVEFTKNAWGKPSFSNYPQLHFSISHSGEWVVCGIYNQKLGIDIQKEKNVDEKIAKRFFSTMEYEFLEKQQDQEQRKDFFYRMWTAKESYVKLTGTSMTTGLSDYICDLENNRIFDKDTSKYAKIEFKEVESDYRLCVCTYESDCEIELTFVSINKLLEECYAEYNGEECSTKR